MRDTNLRRLGITAVAGSLLLVSGTAPFALAGKSQVQILGIDRSGSDSGVTLLNSGRQARTGTLVFEVEIGGRHLMIQQRFRVPAGNKVFVSFISPDRKGRIVNVGIIVDDGAPF